MASERQSNRRGTEKGAALPAAAILQKRKATIAKAREALAKAKLGLSEAGDRSAKHKAAAQPTLPQVNQELEPGVHSTATDTSAESPGHCPGASADGADSGPAGEHVFTRADETDDAADAVYIANAVTVKEASAVFLQQLASVQHSTDSPCALSSSSPNGSKDVSAEPSVAAFPYDSHTAAVPRGRLPAEVYTALASAAADFAEAENVINRAAQEMDLDVGARSAAVGRSLRYGTDLSYVIWSEKQKLRERVGSRGVQVSSVAESPLMQLLPPGAMPGRTIDAGPSVAPMRMPGVVDGSAPVAGRRIWSEVNASGGVRALNSKPLNYAVVREATPKKQKKTLLDLLDRPQSP